MILHEKTDDCFDDCRRCARKKRLDLVNNNNPQPFYIVVYGITRCYGGPEEGGWWYDWQEVLETKRVWTITQALKEVRRIKEDYPQPKYNRYSVLGGEDIVVDIIPTLDFIYETQQRPRYE